MRSLATKQNAKATSHAADGGTPPPVHPLLRLQGTAGNRAVQNLLAHGGQEVPHRASMERAFRADFSSVRAHRGVPAVLDPIDASAATSGERVAFASADPDPHAVAHELAHVVQQRRGGGTHSSPGRRRIAAVGSGG